MEPVSLTWQKIQDPNDWGQIRGKKIATVFQDPMTSPEPDYHNRKTDHFCYHEASEC